MQTPILHYQGTPDQGQRPLGQTNVRYGIIAVTMLMAFILYLDRICMGKIVQSASFHHTTGLSDPQIGKVLGAFFFTYALFQVPAGWASDRFGARAMLTIYIALWSVFTLMTGFMGGFVGLMLARLLCGVGEAGAYPTCMAMIRKWIPVSGRAGASGLVSFGGRFGGTLAPVLTAAMIFAMGSWRTSLWIDGVAGLFVAAIFWIVVRSTPHQHPKVSDAEIALIGQPQAEEPFHARELLGVLWSFVKSLSLWCNSAAQFLTNIGWAFLVTWLPTYLVKERHVSEWEAGAMNTIVLLFGMFGQLVGGWFCDIATRRLGLRWGRVLPMSSSMFFCAAAYFCCPYLHSTWLLVGCCAMVSFATDVANPAGWAFTGDIAGRATAAAGGWANMWGNFGASVVSMLVPWLMELGGAGGGIPAFVRKMGVGSGMPLSFFQRLDVADGKTIVFFTLGGAFVLAGLVSMPIDATKKLVFGKSVTPESVLV